VNSGITRGDAYTGEMTEDRYYRMLGETKPRRSFRYSNLHYTLVGRVIEAVTGQSWKDVLAERVFKPAGMTRTTCDASVAWEDRDVARPYEYEDGRYVTATPLKVDATMHAAGGIFTTANDLARWLRVQLGDGVIDGRRVLPAAAMRTTRELIATEAAEPHPLVKTERRLAWSAGWDARTMRGDTLYCHNGNFSGAGAFFGFMPAPDLGVAVVANGGGASVFLAELVGAEALDGARGLTDEDYLPTLYMIAKKRAERNVTPPANGELNLPASRYAGAFYHDDWGTLEIKAVGDSLDAKIGVMPLAVKLTGRDRFDASGWAGRFEINAAGKVAAVWLNTAEPDSARLERQR
jgi:CubicO group peptidase (beta-lactamase class C family)